jgi:hypothetical protein
MQYSYANNSLLWVTTYTRTQQCWGGSLLKRLCDPVLVRQRATNA